MCGNILGFLHAGLLPQNLPPSSPATLAGVRATMDIQRQSSVATVSSCHLIGRLRKERCGLPGAAAEQISVLRVTPATTMPQDARTNGAEIASQRRRAADSSVSRRAGDQAEHEAAQTVTRPHDIRNREISKRSVPNLRQAEPQKSTAPITIKVTHDQEKGKLAAEVIFRKG